MYELAEEIGRARSCVAAMGSFGAACYLWRGVRMEREADRRMCVIAAAHVMIAPDAGKAVSYACGFIDGVRARRKEKEKRC